MNALRNASLRLALLLVLALAPQPLAAQLPERRPAAWTLDDAMKELGYHPNDPYLQYVTLQLALREGKEDAIAGTINRINGGNPPGRRPNLFDTFTGAVAIQENLQLDTMQGRRGREPERAGPPVKIAALAGPTVQSHPWEKLLGAKMPDVGPLAGLVPHDLYFVEFRTATKLYEALAVGNVWGNHIFAQVLGQSRSQLTVERVKSQLGLGTVSPAVLDRLGIEGIAVVGSDLFVSEGSDVTVLVRGKEIAAAAEAIANLTTVQREVGTHAGIAYNHQRSADGKLDVYLATPSAELHVRGNSLPAFRRVLETIAGKGAKRLGETAEFRYVRSLMPRDGALEDGFVYLSDSFIRHMVGPQLKIAERRRLLVYNHLRMIGHACLMFRTEFGRAPKSFEELAATKCAPGTFGQGDLAHPDGGTYALAADGMSGVCSRYGTAVALAPCIERKLDEVTFDEAENYRQFVKDYEQYWRTYFDPIAVQVRVSPEQLRLETLVLPLIGNSFYAELVKAVGGKPVVLDTLPTAKSCIGSLLLQINKEPYLAQLPAKGEEEKPLPPNRLTLTNNLKQIALAMHSYHDAYGAFPATAAFRDKNGKALLSWRVAILPFLEEGELFKQFRTDEPWDSEHNKKLIPKMPKVFAGPSKALNVAGKTTCLVPVGKDTVFLADGKGTKFADIADGTSNTILAVPVTEEEAVVWTKPDDWAFDPKKPTRGLANTGNDSVLALMADGSVQTFSLKLPEKDWAGLMTRAGGEVLDVFPPQNEARGRNAFFDFPIPPGLLAEIDSANLRRFLRDGIGDHVGVHMFDESRLIDFDFSGILGGAGENGLGMSANQRLGLGLLIQGLIRPTAVSVPVKDAKLVDEMIEAYDRWTIEMMSNLSQQSRSFLPVKTEFYRVHLPAPHAIRCSTFQFFGFKIRIFWGRIGNGFYVANRPFVIDDIAAAHTEAEKAGRRPKPELKANAMLRIRPENWNRVLPGYRLGWAENDRSACHENLSLLSSVGRGWNDRELLVDAELLRRVGQVYGTRPICPEGGRYTISPDGRACQCSVHGSRRDPRQPAVPTDASASGKLLKNLGGVTATLLFQDDGLRAVVTVDRNGK